MCTKPMQVGTPPGVAWRAGGGEGKGLSGQWMSKGVGKWCGRGAMRVAFGRWGVWSGAG